MEKQKTTNFSKKTSSNKNQKGLEITDKQSSNMRKEKIFFQ